MLVLVEYCFFSQICTYELASLTHHWLLLSLEEELGLFVAENGSNDFGLGLKGTKQAKI